MKTDPPASAPRTPRPKGRVFDVMRPGKAPASPTSRPVVIGHKHEAQQAQVKVSGIGGPELRDNLGAHKIAIHPLHDTSGEQAPEAKTSVRASEPAATAAPAMAATPPPPERPAPAAQTTSEAPVVPSKPPIETPAPSAPESAPDPLAALVAERETTPPLAPAPEPHPALPAAETPQDDNLQDAAAPSLKGQVVVSHHSMISDGSGRLVALILLVVVFALIVLDILLDVGIINLTAIPHTNLF